MTKKPAAKKAAKPAAKKAAAKKSVAVPTATAAKTSATAVDRDARSAIKLIATALAGLSGLPSEEQARVDAAVAAAGTLEV